MLFLSFYTARHLAREKFKLAAISTKSSGSRRTKGNGGDFHKDLKGGFP